MPRLAGSTPDWLPAPSMAATPLTRQVPSAFAGARKEPTHVPSVGSSVGGRVRYAVAYRIVAPGVVLLSETTGHGKSPSTGIPRTTPDGSRRCTDRVTTAWLRPLTETSAGDA